MSIGNPNNYKETDFLSNKTMKAAIISLGSISSKLIYEAMKKYFDEVDHLDITELEVPLGAAAQVYYKGQPLDEYDCVYARGSHRYSSLLRAVTTMLQKKTYMPLRAGTYTIGHNKVLTHLKLQEFNIPQPKTYLAATAEAGKKIIKNVTFPVVMKLPAGTHGKGVMFAESAESARSMIDALALLGVPFLMQEYIETRGKDIRCIVVGEKVVAAMMRTAAKGERRANIHAGGYGERIQIDEKTRAAAVNAAKACGADICAVDLLLGIKGPLVLEINLSPGLQGIQKTTKIDVANYIAEYLYKQTKEKRTKSEKKVIKQEIDREHEILGTLDFRGNRILLPEVATKATGLKENEEVLIKVKKGSLEIKKV